LLPGGEPFPQRDSIVFITFVVIFATLVLQGLTLPPLIRGLKVGSDWSLLDEHARARQALGSAAAAAIEKLAAEENAAPELAERIHAEFADQIAHTTADAGGAPAQGPRAGLAGRLRQAALQAERQELLRIWRDNQISDDVLHYIEEDLDYQESHL